MLVLCSSFHLVLQLWIGIVMVIVAMSRQSFDSRPSDIVCAYKEVRGTIMLEFHVGVLIVSCGCFWCLGGSNLGVV